MTKGMSEADMEKAYSLVAQAIDSVGENREALFLSKLCLSLAHKLGEVEQVEDAIAVAQQGLSQVR